MEHYAELIEFSWTLPIMWINILILFLVLKKFFWDKIRNFMLAREASVRDAFENADNVNKLADEKLADYEKQIAGIEGEGREIIRAAKMKADTQAKNIVDEANQKASQIILQAQEEIERERVKAVAEMKGQIADLAILAAERILQKELDAKGQEAMIMGIIEEAGKAQWQN